MSVYLFFIDSALQDEIDISDDEQSQEMLSTENVVHVRVLREEFKPMMTTIYPRIAPRWFENRLFWSP